VETLEVIDSTLRGEYKKVRKAPEFVMELVEDVEEEDLKGIFLKRRGKYGGQVLTGCCPNNCCIKSSYMV